MRLPITIAAVLLTGVLAVQSTQAATPAEAPVKLRLCQPCTMPDVPVTLPAHGMVLFHWSFFRATSMWYTVDLDRGEVSRILTRKDRETKKVEILERTTYPIAPGDLSALKQIASRTWASPDKLPSRMATDVWWELWQLDGTDVRNDGGSGLADGLAKETEEIIERVVSVPASSE